MCVKNDKGESVALRINFDDRKPFEETTNVFLFLKKYFYNISDSQKDWI